MNGHGHTQFIRTLVWFVGYGRFSVICDGHGGQGGGRKDAERERVNTRCWDVRPFDLHVPAVFRTPPLGIPWSRGKAYIRVWGNPFMYKWFSVWVLVPKVEV